MRLRPSSAGVVGLHYTCKYQLHFKPVDSKNVLLGRTCLLSPTHQSAQVCVCVCVESCCLSFPSSVVQVPLK